jgi:hypothetical protein
VAGDDFNTRDILLTEALATLVAGVCGVVKSLVRGVTRSTALAFLRAKTFTVFVVTWGVSTALTMVSRRFTLAPVSVMMRVCESVLAARFA